MALELELDLSRNETVPWLYFLNGTRSNYEFILNDVVGRVSDDCQKWLLSIIACILVGLSGIFPLFFMQSGEKILKNPPTFLPDARLETKLFKRILNFAVGSLLGNVFLHLLPEAWQSARDEGLSDQETLTFLSFWILVGIVSFMICSMLVSSEDGKEESSKRSGSPGPTNNNVDKWKEKEESANPNHVTGYLNLIANGFDNFTHGLAVAGSFINSPRIGCLTTAAILLHEIPHEIGDFAILLRSGFNPWSAAKAQLSTATIGLFGALFTLSVDCMKTIGNFTWWILPFTSGCFINIALTNLLPDLLKDDDPRESLKQFASLLVGIGVMALVTVFFEV